MGHALGITNRLVVGVGGWDGVGKELKDTVYDNPISGNGVGDPKMFLVRLAVVAFLSKNVAKIGSKDGS